MSSEASLQPSPYRWFLHCFTVLYFTMSFVVRFTWPPVIPIAVPELGMSMSGAGAFMSAFFIGYVITQIPGGVLSDRFGSRLVFCAALVIEGLGSIGVSFAPDFQTGFAFRVVTGLGGGMVFASCVRFIVSIFPVRELGLAFGLLLTAPSGMGVIVPNALMPWLLSYFDWRGAFLVVGVAGICMGLIALCVVRDKPTVKEQQKFFSRLVAVLRHPSIFYLGLVGFCLIGLTVGFVSWGNTRVKSLGFSIEEASSVMIAFGVGGMLGSPFGGFVVQKLRNIRKPMMIIFLCLAPATWFFHEVVALHSLVMSSALLGFLIGFVNPFTLILTSKHFEKDSMGTAGGVTGCMYQMGAMITPFAMGYSIDKTENFSVAWLVLSLLPLLAIFALWQLNKPQSSQS